MNTIRFSNDYDKLPLQWGGTEAILIGIAVGDIEWLKKNIPSFIELDTKIRNSKDHYPLDFDTAIVLTFFHIGSFSPKLFTTIRRYTPEKYEYYKKKVWEAFTLKDERLWDENTS